MRTALVITALFAFAVGIISTAYAQNSENLTFHLPIGQGVGPYSGMVRFAIGAGIPARRIHPRFIVRVTAVNGKTQETEQRFAPGNFDWNTSEAETGENRLQLIGITQSASGDIETVYDTVSVFVRERTPSFARASSLPRRSPASSSPITLSDDASPQNQPRFQVRSGAFDTTVRIALGAWSENGDRIPLVRIRDRSGRLLQQIGAETNHGQAVFTWNADDAPKDTYRLELVLVDMRNDNPIADLPALDSVTIRVTGTASETPLSHPRMDTERPARQPALPESRYYATPTALDVIAIARRIGDPQPEVAAAQFALESAWGAKTSGRYNYFGIKAHGEPYTEKATREFENGQWLCTTARFVNYESPEAGIRGRLDFLRRNTRYSAYHTASNAEEAAVALQRAGYATDPNYAAQLIALIRRLRTQNRAWNAVRGADSRLASRGNFIRGGLYSQAASGSWSVRDGIVYHKLGDRQEAYLPWNGAPRSIERIAADATGCWLLSNGSHRRITVGQPNDGDGYGGYVRAELGDDSAHAPIADAYRRMVGLINDWMGTPYSWGNQSKSGTDCSGFVLSAHRAAGVELPRTSGEMAQCNKGKRITGDLHWGDVLCFNGHVALYIGNGQTVESRTHSGVSKFHIWTRTPIIVRRFLPSVD